MNQLTVPSPPMIHTSVKFPKVSGQAREKILWLMFMPDNRRLMFCVSSEIFALCRAGLHTRAIRFSGSGIEFIVCLYLGLDFVHFSEFFIKTKTSKDML